ncbi:MAG: hypothetical protein H6551_10035 [Chitinophagales bacterium]|nr:hypothetical protein [Chitinophagales bacterium]
MAQSVDLSHIYKSRSNFTVIGLTGRTSSGCSTVAGQLVLGFNNGTDFEPPFSFNLNHNSYRKYRIIYDYAKVNFKPYSLIKYRHVLTLFLLKRSFNEFLSFLRSEELKEEFKKSKFNQRPDFESEISDLEVLRETFNDFSARYNAIDFGKLYKEGVLINLYDFFFDPSFSLFSERLSDILKNKSLLKRNKILQVISNNLRKSGDVYNNKFLSPDYIDTIVELINTIIKSHREKFPKGQTQIVIDSLRNPMEIHFFKQRFSAYYTIAINRDEKVREGSLAGKFTLDNFNDREQLLKEEYKGGEDWEFFKQNIETCIQQADIHISLLEKDEAEENNKKKQDSKHKDNTSPYFSWRMQLLKCVSLISHPGLITPSPEERCMQLAFTAKHNSGCISRHVGAAITDENYSVKAIGWNNTPEGQVPCVLRNVEDLLNRAADKDTKAFTPYERSDPEFRTHLEENYKEQVSNNKDNLQGRTACFCFKSLKNCYSEGKNQVHTRSLHAEESAFLQLTKYGGTGIQGGKLFTTASPCELCSKKAYQLGIKVIYYIDPYPGISNKQILEAGDNKLEVRLFNGIIGNAYHWLYDPIMPYKDELGLLLGNPIKDLTSKYESKINEQKETISQLQAKIEELEKNNS